ncbi:MAG: hypothetical protein ACE5FH_01535 [Candidatus Zixiibacteriota bacterium]
MPIVTWLAVGCGSGHEFAPGSEDAATAGRTKQGKKVDVEAYLFDAKLKRRGKPTSFRLDLLLADSSAALSGRGYLGKGAFKGVLSHDSLRVFFPSTNEYLSETVYDLLASFSCRVPRSQVNLFDLLRSFPDSAALDRQFSVISNRLNPRRWKFGIYPRNCAWLLEITYKRQKGMWRVLGFVFEDGEGTSLKATRRKFRPESKVRPDRLRLSLRGDAIRIIP